MISELWFSLPKWGAQACPWECLQVSQQLYYLDTEILLLRQRIDSSRHNIWDFPCCYFPDIHLQGHLNKSTILLSIFLLLTLFSQHPHCILTRHSARAIAVEKTKSSLLQPAVATQLMQTIQIPLTLKKIVLICTSWIAAPDLTKQTLLLLIFLQMTIL